MIEYLSNFTKAKIYYKIKSFLIYSEKKINIKEFFYLMKTQYIEFYSNFQIYLKIFKKMHYNIPPQEFPLRGVRREKMRKNVILMALICLLFVFQAVFAQIDPDPYNRPQAIENLVYNGSFMDLYQKGTSLLGGESYTFYYRKYGKIEWVKDEVLQAKYPGYYTIEWKAVPEGGNIEDQPLNSIGVEINQKKGGEPQVREDLVYDPEKPDDQQFLIDPEHDR